MRRARFQIVARLEHASVATSGTVTIDRATGVVEIRPHRRRRVYLTTLAALASYAVRAELRAEEAERRKNRRRRRSR